MTVAEPVEVVTSPEGIELRFQRATASERLVAIAVDLGLMLVLTLLVGGAAWLLLGTGAALVVSFVIRHGWFVWFETRWNGRTPGKRLFHLRVIRGDGGPLTVETVLARNLTREVELYLPLTLLAMPDALFADHTGVVRLLAVVWILLLLFFPLFNAHRLRVGDLLAGTRVVVSPRSALVRDLAAAVPPRGGNPEPDAGFHFTREQLSIYGEHELSVLEDLLRRARLAGGAQATAAVADAICRRIGWADRAALGDRPERFLQAFYRAQRQHLEQQLLLGRRRLRKRSPPRGEP